MGYLENYKFATSNCITLMNVIPIIQFGTIQVCWLLISHSGNLHQNKQRKSDKGQK